MDKIKTAYKASENIYDDVLTKSKWWSKLYNDLFWRVDDNLLVQKVLEFIPENFKGKLLDIPVGTGIFTAQSYSKMPKADITCVDYSEAMLQQAKIRFDKYKLSNINCQQGDVGNLQFENESFDLVLSMNGFHAFPDKEKAFKETARVIKKEGMFIGTFYVKNSYKPTDFIVNNVLAKRGWFTPPFYSLSDVNGILNRLYTKVCIFQEKAIVYFKCIR